MRNAKIESALGALLAVLLWTQPSLGQLPGASPATLGTANNYTALARGFAAVGLNPAGLGMPGNPTFTLALFPAKMSQSLDPLSFSDFTDYAGVLVPASVKEEWLQKIAAAGGQTGSGAVEVSPFSFSWGNFGAQLSTIASVRTDLTDAAAEMLLFGSAGRTGEPADLDLQGSGVDGYAVTTLGISAGIPLARRWVPGLEQGLSIGFTVKQSWGHVLAFAEDEGTSAQSDPLGIELDFPTVQPPDNWKDWKRGTGLGIDVGFAWTRGPWRSAAVVQNLVSSFKWKLDKLVYRPGTGSFGMDPLTTVNTSDFSEIPASVAPEAIKDKVKELTFKPILALGGAYDALENLTLTAEFRERLGDGLDTGPKRHMGMGLEYRPSPFVPLRAGFAAITDGFQVGGGLGLILGPIHFGVGGMYQTGDVGDGMAGTIGLSYGGRVRPAATLAPRIPISRLR